MAWLPNVAVIMTAAAAPAKYCFIVVLANMASCLSIADPACFLITGCGDALVDVEKIVVRRKNVSNFN
ncbi:MAG: hypothetical protein HN420_08135 [Rhodospirillaceae bacterium]|nr:hypothetical protein [Rhodospirillaceae bacterium]